MSTAARVFVIAGEPSGDALGANLMAALKDTSNGRVEFNGVGGPLMRAQGLASQFSMDDLAVMGLAEVLPRLGLLLKRIKETANAVERLKPDVLVTIDAPDFCFRVIKKLKARGVDVPAVHYVAPTVWAWRPGRAKKVARFLDHLMCLFPFEPPYFEREGLDATFVGHPVVFEAKAHAGDGKGLRARLDISPAAPVLAVLPGSRTGEVDRLLPVFGEAVAKLHARLADLHVVIPTLDHLRTRIETETRAWPVPVHVVGPKDKTDAFAAADGAIAASGTVGLELAAHGTPHVIGYRVSAITAFIARRLVKTPYAHLVNIVLGREAVAEFIQQDCTPDNLARAVAPLMQASAQRHAQLGAFSEAMEALGQDERPPSERAANVVLECIARHQSTKGEQA